MERRSEERNQELFESYSFEVGGTEYASDLTEVSEQQTEDLCRPLLMMSADLLQGGELPLNCLQTHLQIKHQKKKN